MGEEEEEEQVLVVEHQAQQEEEEEEDLDLLEVVAVEQTGTVMAVAVQCTVSAPMCVC